MSLDPFGDINYLAVVVAAIAYFAAGALWYAPPLFGKAWMEAAGIRPPEGGPPVAMYAFTFVTTFVASLALAFVARASGADSVADGILLGLVAGIGLALPVLLVTQTYEQRPPRLPFINAGYHTLGFVVASIIVTVWD